MGWLRKATGAQDQIDAANANEAATSKAAIETAQANIKQSNEAALQAAQQQQQVAEREAASQEAAAAASTPLESAQVQLDSPSDTSAAATARLKRKKFGTGAYSTGVNL